MDESPVSGDTAPEGPELDTLVAEKVMGETRPALVHEHFHVDPIPSPGGNWVCCPAFERGDVCEWHPVPYSTRMSAAWSVVEKLEPLVGRFETSDGFLHLSVGHWADHGDCVGSSPGSEKEDETDDPEPWSFHIHLGVLAASADLPPHWEHGQRFCASSRTAPLAVCRAALRAYMRPAG